MIDPLQDELLSAYLDEELSAEERQRVEQRLAENPRDRQLVEELRLLRNSLQSMPRYELDAQFRDRVLRQAERAMLTRPGAAATTSAPVRHWRRWLPVRGLRPLVWPAVAAAAAIMLMVVYRARDDARRQVAQNIRVPAEVSDPAADRPASARADRPASVAVVTAKDRGPTPSREAVRSTMRAAKRPAEESEEVDGRAHKGVSAAASVTRAPTGPIEKGEAPGRVRGVRVAGDQELSKTVLDEEADVHGFRRPAPRMGAERFRRPKAAAPSTPLADYRFAVPRSPGRGTMIVRVDVSQTAARAGAFDKLLARQQISRREDDHGQVLADEQLGQVQSEQRVVVPQRDADSVQTQRRLGRSTGPDERLVFVVATPRQVHGALKDLRAQADQFPAFFVSPDPREPRQQLFDRYSYRRGRPGGGMAGGRANVADPDDSSPESDAKRADMNDADVDLAGTGHRNGGGLDKGREHGQPQKPSAAPSADQPPGEGVAGKKDEDTGPPATPVDEVETTPLQVLFVLRVVDPESVGEQGAPVTDKPE